MTGHWLDTPDGCRTERDRLRVKSEMDERELAGHRERASADLLKINELEQRLAAREVWIVETFLDDDAVWPPRTFTSYERAQKWVETLPEGTPTWITQSWPDQPQKLDELAARIRKALR